MLASTVKFCYRRTSSFTNGTCTNVHYIVISYTCSKFEWKQICGGFLSFVYYICIAVGDPVIKRGSLRLRSSYQEGKLKVGDPVIKRGSLRLRSSYQEGKLKVGIQLSRGEA